MRQLPPVAGDKGRGFVKSKSMLIALAEGDNGFVMLWFNGFKAAASI